MAGYWVFKQTLQIILITHKLTKELTKGKD